MAKRAIHSKHGKTYMGSVMWRPRQGDTVHLNRRLPLAPAVYPEGETMKLNEVEWAGTTTGEHVLDGDAFTIGGAGSGYLLYVTVNGARSMIYCRSKGDVDTLLDGDRHFMRERSERTRVVAALAWTLLDEEWREAPIGDETPIFLLPGEPLHDAAVEAAEVLCDAVQDCANAYEYLRRRVSMNIDVLESWIVPFGKYQDVRVKLQAPRWYVRQALWGHKPAGKRHGRLPKRVEVPDWRDFAEAGQLRELAIDFWQRTAGGVGFPGKELNP
jgi:hypothetical protein